MAEMGVCWRLDMVVVIEKECVGCGICVCFCPVDALGGFGVIQVDHDKCIECFDCVGVCPMDALEVQ